MKTMQQINEYISPELQKANNIIGVNLAMFIAQSHHETMGFRRFMELTNYTSAEQLIKTFPKHFNTENVNRYLGQPIKIASRAYSKRMGNGDEPSCDGYVYRGSGGLMLTGLADYIRFTKDIDPASIKPYYADKIGKSKELCLTSAIWVWHDKKLANCDVYTCTRRLNGGQIGIEDRVKLFESYRKIVK
jgi:putative chitinase